MSDLLSVIEKNYRGGGRLPVVMVAEREADALRLFRDGMSPKQVNHTLKEKYGKQMRAKRLYELNRTVKMELATVFFGA